MKNKQISFGMWKNHIVHFNGKQGKVVDWIEGTNRFLVEFLNDMHMALVGDRRITRKMIQSVQNANRHYNFARNPKNIEKRKNIIMKLSNLQGMVKECHYTSDYRADRELLIQSFKDQVSRKGTLTKKQFIYANNLYTQFKKRIDKVKKEKK
jgi:hypothetical protein